MKKKPAKTVLRDVANHDRHYIGEVTEYFGEYEADCKFIFLVPANKDRIEIEAKMSQEWREVDEMDEDGLWWFGDGAHGSVDSREIPKEDFDVLGKYLNRLRRWEEI